MLPSVTMATRRYFVTSTCVMFLFLIFARADDFQELNLEEEVGTYSPGEFRANKRLIELGQVNGTILWSRDLLSYYCKGRLIPFVGVFPAFTETTNPKKVTIRDCALPTTPIANALRDLNIDVSNIEALQLALTHIRDPLPTGNYTEGLNIKTLFIDAMFSENILKRNPDFLKPLSNLTTLMVWGTQMPDIPENVHLEIISIRHEAWVNNWTNCKHLRMLSIINVSANLIPRFWPEECKNLTHIRLKGLTNAAGYVVMASGIMTVTSKLEVLYMQWCNMTNPPYTMLKTAKNLKHLNLTGNRILDDTLIDIPLLKDLTNLDVSRNFLTGMKIVELVKQTPNLKYFNLNKNKKFKEWFCYQNDLRKFAYRLKSLEHLSLSNIPAVVPDCFQNIHFSKLEYLDMSSSEENSKGIESINLRQLPTTDAKQLKVDLRGRHIKWVEFNGDDYIALRKGEYHQLWGSTKSDRRHRAHLTVFLNTTNYDCRSHWFCVALLKYPDLVTSPDFKCPNSIESFNKEGLLNCEVEFQNGCTIKYDERGNDTVNGILVKCDDKDSVDLETVSELYNFTKLSLHNNRIASLQNLNIPDSVEWLDLRGNRLTSFDVSDLDQLFLNPSRRILLSNNSFVCDCKMISKLHHNKSQIMDFDKITVTCKDQELLHLLKPDECKEETSYKTAFIVTVSVIFALKITFLFFWYKNVIKRCMTRRGWCKCCCKSEINDAVAWESVRPNKAYSQEDLVDK